MPGRNITSAKICILKTEPTEFFIIWPKDTTLKSVSASVSNLKDLKSRVISVFYVNVNKQATQYKPKTIVGKHFLLTFLPRFGSNFSI